ncbi:WD40 repeat domain-containing protein [Nocardioides lianchengensis]|uniref:Uncharacterized protein n=1 Tax=Nocardioides lianchengensis TaxID=1045774 RepID=A0A1G6Q170_9ACTN|nr:WD40 repeat domain-containing protein [Nocardioides lianchengensis]NYG12034.1 hypothetical protein [Nocardioides lianchengensis]SDC85387.1 hypothetical protein SAMN05421872_104202 [Nocardioides lianchengensis]
MSIHDELERIAARAPEVVVPADMWARARRARRRDRLGVVAAVVAVLAVAGTLAWLPTRDGLEPVDGRTLGVPNRLWAVPERMSDRENDDSWMRDEVSSQLDVGTAAAAWTTPGGLPVVVGAADGAYHLLDLPDFGGNNFLLNYGLGGSPVALSPDGLRLAYAYAHFGPDAATEPIPSGVRVLDLEEGSVTDHPILGAEGTAVGTLTWSSDGRWLGWTGERYTSWTESSTGSASPFAGRIDLTTGSVDQMRIGEPSAMTVAIAADGVLSIVGNDRMVRWDGERREARRLRGFWSGRGVVTADGSIAAGIDSELAVQLLDRRLKVSTIDASGELNPVAGGTATVLGITADRLVVRTSTLDSSDGALLLLERDGISATVAAVDADVPDTLTLATDLMTTERPTVDRPEPDWPTDWGRVLTIGGWILVGAAALALLAWTVLLRTRRSPYSSPGARRPVP